MARQADLGRTRAEIARQRAVVQEATAKTELERAGLAAASAEAVRSTELAARGADSGQRRDEAVAARRQQEARLNASAAAARGATMQTDLLVAQLRQNEAALEAAKAARDRARVDLEATTVTASQAGRVGDRTVVAGQFVQPGTRVMTIVPTTEIYLVANFKETQISRMRVGQPVTVEVDALPDRKLAGKVLSLAPGTGAQFALLPPENATGNFNKIVQRVPVRIALTVPAEVGSLVVPGLSAEVEVDTR
jgi:membrane fusion protein (multidrug efflux system)